MNKMLRKAEAEQVAELSQGDRMMLRRPVRRRNGKKLNLTVQRGHILTNGEVYAQVLRIVEADEHWVLKVERTESWAAKQPEKELRSRKELEEILPGVLSFPEAQKLEVGDWIVFDHKKIRDPNGPRLGREGWYPGGDPISEDAPDVYIEITSAGRGKKGDYIYRYRKHGFEADEYLAYKLGYTTNRHRALDDQVVVHIREDLMTTERDHNAREHKRLQMMRAEHQRQIVAGARGAELIRLTASLTDIERKMRRLQGDSEGVAA